MTETTMPGEIDRRQLASGARGLLLSWYLPLLAGTAPVLVLGFEASGLANRLIFAGWGLLAAAGYTALLRGTLARGARAATVAAVCLGWLAIALALFAALAVRHQEIYDLGLRAVAPGLYRGWMTAPGSYWVAAGLLALAAVVSAVVGRRGRRPAGGREEVEERGMVEEPGFNGPGGGVR